MKTEEANRRRSGAVVRPKVPPGGKGECAICKRQVRLIYGAPDMGTRLFISRHNFDRKLCDGSFEDYTPRGEGKWDRWG